MKKIDVDIEKEEIIEPLQGAIDYIDKVLLRKDLISQALEEENYGVAFEKFNNLISGIESLNQLLYNVDSLLPVDYNELQYEGRVINDYIKQFNDFLAGELIIAMKNEDYFLLSDLIHYELEVHLKEYRKIFICLLEYISEIEFV
ncbi:hypothetical protein Halha_2267 [Halobacteroides halobius DSM 5150]|uniref:Uncharacterized protein n=1 Tax=Halobacteroides halobius (strain ATCC 35273 / DSM 5150 / MD-1) TaxID=748449 RepID=L0KAU8_HALHC|nr:hypothetical protein [Halobacteroides halobius]AGB42141.1 hypothetical protein Halha_2267 [Halobacteroides halobius DSM 5150]